MTGTKRLISIVLLLLFLAPMWGVSNAAAAATAMPEPNPMPAPAPILGAVGLNQSAPSCWPLDVVLLVDQSYSMFEKWPLNVDAAERKNPSDPDGYRFDAAYEILDRLIQNRQDECPQAVHRFGLITFGNRAETILDMVQIDLTSADDSKTWAQNYRASIDRAAEDRTQEGTNPRLAFETAAEMLQRAGDLPTPEGYGPRRTVTILVTDGAPDGVGDVPAYMCDMVDYLNRDAWLDSSIWVLALNASVPYMDKTGCDGTLRYDYEDIVSSENRTRKGEVNSRDYMRQAIPSFVSDVVSAEFGQTSDPVNCGEVFFVDPYLEQSILSFFHDKQSPDSPVTISYMGDQPGEPIYQFKAGEVMKDATTGSLMTVQSYKTRHGKEEVIFNRPRPGAWRFDIEGLTSAECQGRVTASKVPIKPVVTLVNPRAGIPVPVVASSPYYDPAGQSPIEIELRGKDGQPIPYESSFPLTVKVNYSLPSGVSKLPDGTPASEVTLAPAQGSRWASPQSVLAPAEGIYTLTVVGETLFGNGQQGNQFFSEMFSYSARKINAFSFSIESPQPGERVPCNKIVDGQSEPQPVTVRIQVRDDARQPVKAETYLVSDPAQAFAAVVLDKQGNPLAEPLTMVAAAGQPGVFEAQLPAGSADNLACGDAKVRVDFKGQYAIDQYTLLQQSQAVELTRVKASGVQVTILNLDNEPTLRIHQDFIDACPNGSVSPILFDVELHDLDGNHLDPQNVVQGDDPTQLYTGKLFAPDQSQSAVTFRLEEREQGYVLAGTAGEDITQTGKYTIVLQPNKPLFKAEYVVSQAKDVQVTLNREDPWFTMPRTCGISIGAGALLLAGLAGLLIYGFTGGPGGSLEIIRGNESNPIITVPMRHSRWFARAKRKDLEELGIGEIAYSKSRGWSGDDKRAVRLVVKSTEGEDVFDSVIEDNDRQGFVGDFDVRYS